MAENLITRPTPAPAVITNTAFVEVSGNQAGETWAPHQAGDVETSSGAQPSGVNDAIPEDSADRDGEQEIDADLRPGFGERVLLSSLGVGHAWRSRA